MANLGEWTFTVDRDATAEAYAAEPKGGADSCECIWCRNFRVVRSEVFPAGFLTLLDELGIDFRKDGEVFEAGKLGPGLHFYAGWYHFVGTLERAGDFEKVAFGPDFRAYLAPAHAPRLDSLAGRRVVQLEFECDAVPWRLQEDDPG